MSGADPLRPAAGRPLVVTIAVEDYFHAGVFDGLIPAGRWERFDHRIVESTEHTLDLLRRFDAKATFFVMGWVAEKLPDVPREIIRQGHEVASQGFLHRTIAQMTPAEFRDDLRRSRAALEYATGRRVLGHRVPHFLGPDDLWALDVLVEEGWAYDSSVRPFLGRFRREPWRAERHVHEHGGQQLIELPVSSTRLGPVSLPLAGGNWFRQLPERLVHATIGGWERSHDAPFVLYFHTWETDHLQPRIDAVSWLSQQRHYRNLDRMPRLIGEILESHDCRTAADWLGLVQEEVDAPAPSDRPHGDTAPEIAKGPRDGITIVIPCYNESATLRYTANTLEQVEDHLSQRWDVSFIFVDDGSSDDTLAGLEDLFGTSDNKRVIAHQANQGVAAAIMTGLRAAETEIVCSMDCDCTYDPLELSHMIPLLKDGVDLVTASPYHPDGEVVNVPGWRLVLSRGASTLYRAVLDADLHTYTSCFRVYRRSAVQELELSEGGFLGVAELLAQVLLHGGHVIEHPATLEVRVFGQSKMKTARAVASHLRLLSRLGLERSH